MGLSLELIGEVVVRAREIVELVGAGCFWIVLRSTKLLNLWRTPSKCDVTLASRTFPRGRYQFSGKFTGFPAHGVVGQDKEGVGESISGSICWAHFWRAIRTFCSKFEHFVSFSEMRRHSLAGLSYSNNSTCAGKL